MTPDTIYALLGSSLGVGLIVGGAVSIFNSWMP